MRSEIGVHPWAHIFQPYLNGEKLNDCTMADEEQGCAEVYADVEVMPNGARRQMSLRKKMIYGRIEDRPLLPVGEKIKADPEHAQEIWDAYRAEMRAKYGE